MDTIYNWTIAQLEHNVADGGWGSVDKDEMEANLAQQIEDQKAPKTKTGVPW